MNKKTFSANVIFTAAVCALAIAGIGVMWRALAYLPFYDTQVPVDLAHPTRVHSGALLYYNAPAAWAVGDDVLVGLIDNTGAVRLVRTRPEEASDVTTVHQYDRADDHGAPAIWVRGEDILVATALHSSDLYLYEVDREGSVSLLCHWTGRYSYPRFIDQGNLRLFVRIEDGDGGHLGSANVGSECKAPEIEYRASSRQWIYATADGDALWSIWDSKTNQHHGVWSRGSPMVVNSSPYPEQLAWSSYGDLAAVSNFRDAFVCCNKGMVESQIVRGNDALYSTRTTTPYYPTGIVFSLDGSEFLTPTGAQITRRETTTFKPLPSCTSPGHNSVGQYVRGGSGSYVYVNWSGDYNSKDFGNVSILLCRPSAPSD